MADHRDMAQSPKPVGDVAGIVDVVLDDQAALHAGFVHLGDLSRLGHWEHPCPRILCGPPQAALGLARPGRGHDDLPDHRSRHGDGHEQAAPEIDAVVRQSRLGHSRHARERYSNKMASPHCSRSREYARSSGRIVLRHGVLSSCEPHAGGRKRRDRGTVDALPLRYSRSRAGPPPNAVPTTEPVRGWQ